MTEQSYDPVYTAIQKVIANGWGEVRIVIKNGKIKEVVRLETERVKDG